MYRMGYCSNFFNKNTPNPPLISFKSTQKFFRQNLPVRKKVYCPRLTAPGGQAQPYNNWIILYTLAATRWLSNTIGVLNSSVRIYILRLN